MLVVKLKRKMHSELTWVLLQSKDSWTSQCLSSTTLVHSISLPLFCSPLASYIFPELPFPDFPLRKKKSPHAPSYSLCSQSLDLPSATLSCKSHLVAQRQLTHPATIVFFGYPRTAHLQLFFLHLLSFVAAQERLFLEVVRRRKEEERRKSENQRKIPLSGGLQICLSSRVQGIWTLEWKKSVKSEWNEVNSTEEQRKTPERYISKT